ncbi:MAG: hypothetical protein U9N39_03815 [Campylobacterota bacterium]|nr:hypothetical protein [Campylobacterota bacterium]
MIRVLLLFFITFSLNAYELPKLELPQKGEPEIIFFEAKSVLVGEKLSYLLKWKTMNATDVNITFIGAIELSGEMTITEEEYNHGPITLNASNKTSKYIDTMVINDTNKDLPPPMVFDKDTEQINRGYYNTMPIRRGVRPYNRRRMY